MLCASGFCLVFGGLRHQFPPEGVGIAMPTLSEDAPLFGLALDEVQDLAGELTTLPTGAEHQLGEVVLHRLDDGEGFNLHGGERSELHLLQQGACPRFSSRPGSR